MTAPLAACRIAAGAVCDRRLSATASEKAPETAPKRAPETNPETTPWNQLGVRHTDAPVLEALRIATSALHNGSVLTPDSDPTPATAAGGLHPSDRSPHLIRLALSLLLGLGAVALEARADTELHSFRRTRRDVTQVLDSGLWARCRHPNYLGEMLFW